MPAQIYIHILIWIYYSNYSLLPTSIPTSWRIHSKFILLLTLLNLVHIQASTPKWHLDGLLCYIVFVRLCNITWTVIYLIDLKLSNNSSTKRYSNFPMTIATCIWQTQLAYDRQVLIQCDLNEFLTVILLEERTWKLTRKT